MPCPWRADYEAPDFVRWSGDLDGSIADKDALLLSAFEREQPWGMDTAIDLFDCDPERLRDRNVIHSFTIDLCETIHMRRYGEPRIVHFGDEPRVSGYTLAQLIETSAITGHFIEQANAACLNIFSCSAYPPFQTAALCQEWFGARLARLSVVFRGPAQGDQSRGPHTDEQAKTVPLS
jgi:S-adenosylmethionine/arginine decarboxylase-like enzyme